MDQKDTISAHGHSPSGFGNMNASEPRGCQFPGPQKVCLFFLMFPRGPSSSFKRLGPWPSFPAPGMDSRFLPASLGSGAPPAGCRALGMWSQAPWKDGGARVTCSPKYATSKANCSLILSSSLMPPPLGPAGVAGAVLLACFSLFRLSSIFLTEFRTSDTVS